MLEARADVCCKRLFIRVDQVGYNFTDKGAWLCNILPIHMCIDRATARGKMFWCQGVVSSVNIFSNGK